MGNLLWIVIAILLILWLGGFAFHFGSWVHLLLVIAVIVLIFQLITGRRAV